MKRARTALVTAIAITVIMLAGTARADAPPPVQKWTIVGLGDSVMAGWACECRAFLELYADGIRSQTRTPAQWTNFGTLAQTSGDLLSMLETHADMQDSVAKANVVVITVGANDFPPNRYMSSCVKLACYKSRAASLRRNLAAIIADIDMLRNHQPTVVRVTDYWAIWKDGAAGRELGPRHVFVNDFITHRINTVMYRVATATKTGFVDLYVPFHGTARRVDDSRLLASDGDHPNAAGHARIARALLQSGLQPLA